MKKKTKIALITTISIITVGIAAVMIYQGYSPDISTLVANEEQSEKESAEVTVKINTEQTGLPEYKEVVDDETGETVMAEVQVNEPIEPKSTTPPEKPVSTGDYTNPEAPPTYTEEQTKVEQPKKTVNNGGSSSSGGKVYVEGFGYVEKPGKTKVQTGVSDGDINKMIGSMD